MAATAVSLRGAGRSYRVGSNVVTALRDVDLDISAGEFVVILGPSGSGKTTLLNLIGALDAPTAGQVSLDGKEISGLSRPELATVRRRTVSFVFQTFNLFPSLTARENVHFGADVAGAKHPGQVAATMLERVGLADRLDHFPHELSGGEQQRVAIARALATGNPILLADEPTGELDFATGVTILRLLAEEAQEGHTVLVVTHNREISRIADRVVELASGVVRRDGPPIGGKADIDELHW